jgi:hypothetical protein
LTGGKGQGKPQNIEFFATENSAKGIPMNMRYRLCAGVKACELLSDDLRLSHREVDEEKGHEWAHCLKSQYHDEGQKFTSAIQVLYDKHTGVDKDGKPIVCECMNPITQKQCKGQWIIRSQNNANGQLTSPVSKLCLMVSTN